MTHTHTHTHSTKKYKNVSKIIKITQINFQKSVTRPCKTGNRNIETRLH